MYDTPNMKELLDINGTAINMDDLISGQGTPSQESTPGVTSSITATDSPGNGKMPVVNNNAVPLAPAIKERPIPAFATRKYSLAELLLYVILGIVVLRIFISSQK